jgi:hypothetical protein
MGRRSGVIKLLALADRVGWRYVRESCGGGHLLLHHEGTEEIPATGQWMTIPKNVTEAPGTHTLANLGRDLLVNAGLSLRGEPGSPGNRRHRRHPSGEATERETTKRIRRAEIRRAARMQMIERLDRDTTFYRRLMHP